MFEPHHTRGRHTKVCLLVYLFLSSKDIVITSLFLLHLSYSLLFIFSFVPYSSCVPYSLNHELKVDTSGDRVLNIAVEVAARCKSDERGSNKSQ